MRRDDARHRAAGITESLVEVESVGELQIKGLSRPVSASNVLVVT